MVFVQACLSNGTFTRSEECRGEWERGQEQKNSEGHQNSGDGLDLETEKLKKENGRDLVYVQGRGTASWIRIGNQNELGG